MSFANGWYCDARNGRFVANIVKQWTPVIVGSNLETERGPVELPNGQCVLNVRIAKDGRFAGIGHHDDLCWEWNWNSGWTSHGVAFGPQSVIYDDDDILRIITSPPAVGYRYALPFNRIVTCDETRSDVNRHIWQFTELGDVTIGQGGDGIYGQDPVIILIDGTRRLLTGGACRFINTYLDNEIYVISFVREDQKVAEPGLYFSREQLLSLPLALDYNSPDKPIVEIDKPCWLTWFEFNQAPPIEPDGNAIVKIRYDLSNSIVNLRDGNHFGSWVDGASVEEIEQKVASNPLQCVAYWDARQWPRYPILKFNDWLALQAYCRNGESPDAFEANMRNLINDAQHSHHKIALVCQCYTSNAGLTSDLKGLVPVYAKLARDYPSIDHLLVFSDQNRATGLNDHPELRPYWKELYEGITGEPGMSDVKIPQKVRDNINALYELHKDLSEGTDDQRRELMKLITEQNRYDLGFQHGWKSADPNRPPSKDAIAYSVTGDDSAGVYIADVFNGATREPSIPENYDFSNQHFIPMDPVNHLGSQPEPGPVGVVDILGYDPVCKRSNPQGCLIRFDVQSPNPVTEAEFDLEGDGEPSVKVMFSDEVARDGRYVRAFAFKFTVNGRWVLRVTAKDNKGNVYKSNGQQTIEVTF